VLIHVKWLKAEASVRREAEIALGRDGQEKEKLKQERMSKRQNHK
jgi:hypothetical protein